MKMIDLSKFEKIAEDKHTATLKHKDGHSMTILLKALQPVQREQMKRLKMAKGGKVKMYDEGSDDQPVSNDDSAPTSDSSSQPQAQGTTININAGGQAPQATNAPPPVQHSQQSAAPTNVQVPSTANPSQGNIVTSANGSNPLNAVQAQQDAIQQQVPIDSFKAKADVQNQQQWLEENKRRQAMLDDAQNEIHNHTNAFADYINKNPVDEKQYAKSLTGGQKTAGLIGLFLGGFSGNHDMYNQINSNIDRNIDAQKQNIANQKSVYSAYNDLYHNDVLATKMAKISADHPTRHPTVTPAFRAR